MRWPFNIEPITDEKPTEEVPNSQPFNVGDYCKLIETAKPLQVEGVNPAPAPIQARTIRRSQRSRTPFHDRSLFIPPIPKQVHAEHDPAVKRNGSGVQHTGFGAASAGTHKQDN
jgi:hypothetical protein